MNNKNLNSIGADIIPKETLYISNLNDKITAQEIKINLYYLFIQFGDIMEIVCRQNKQLRGQAFIVYANTNQASLALKSLQGVNFLGKPMKIQFAKSRSQVLIQVETGNLVPVSSRKLLKVELKAKMVQGPQKKVQAEKNQELQAGEMKPVQKMAAAQIITEMPPNNILLLQNLPEQITQEMLVELFKQYDGFKDARLISAKHMAFIEYGDDNQAQVALIGLNNFKISNEKTLEIQFAKI